MENVDYEYDTEENSSLYLDDLHGYFKEWLEDNNIFYDKLTEEEENEFFLEYMDENPNRLGITLSSLGMSVRDFY